MSSKSGFLGSSLALLLNPLCLSFLLVKWVVRSAKQIDKFAWFLRHMTVLVSSHHQCPHLVGCLSSGVTSL